MPVTVIHTQWTASAFIFHTHTHINTCKDMSMFQISVESENCLGPRSSASGTGGKEYHSPPIIFAPRVVARTQTPSSNSQPHFEDPRPGPGPICLLFANAETCKNRSRLSRISVCAHAWSQGAVCGRDPTSLARVRGSCGQIHHECHQLSDGCCRRVPTHRALILEPNATYM